MMKSEKFRSFDVKGISVLVKSNSTELLDRIGKDFSQFAVPLIEKEYDIKIDSYLEEKISVEIPSWPQVWKSKNSTSYEKGDLRINDYHGKLVSLFDYSSERGQLYSIDIEKLHEVTYLLILSRTGKKLDLDGKHKIHAMGFIYKKIACIGMMNMGVGKSTLLKELLKDKEVQIISDDTPLVKSNGEILSFPLRLGLNEDPDLEVLSPEKNCYHLMREFYGKKHLISLEGISNQVSEQYEKIILFEGIRGDISEIKKMNKVRTFLILQKHMVIGVGLPIILEYFWESGVKDFFLKTKIFFLRQRAAFNLTRKSKTYKFIMNESPSENAELLKLFIEQVER